MSQITAVDKISPKPPPDSLFTPQIIGSIIGQLIPQIVFITMMYWMLNQEPWYIIPDTGTEVIYNIHATAVMFWFCNYQYLIAGFLFSFGREYHKPVYKCFWVMAICAFIFIANAFVLFQNIPAVSSFFEFPHGDYFSSSTSSTSSGSVPLENPYPVPYSFRWKIFGMAMLNFILSFAIEEFMIRIFPSIAAWYSKRFGRKPGVFTPKARREFEKMHHTNNKGSSSSSSSSNTAGNGYGTSDYHSHYSEGGSNGGVGGPCSVSPNSDGEAEAFIAARGKMKRGQKAKMDMVLAMYEKSIRKSRGKSPGLPEDDNDNEAMVEEENISNNNNNNAVRPQKSSSKGKKGKSSGGKGGRGSRSAASGIVTTSSIPSFAGASRRKSPKKKSGGYVRIYDEEDSYDDSARSSYNVSIDNNNDLSSSGMYYNSNPNNYNNNNNNSDSNNGDVCVTISDDDDENNNNNSD